MCRTRLTPCGIPSAVDPPYGKCAFARGARVNSKLTAARGRSAPRAKVCLALPGLMVVGMPQGYLSPPETGTRAGHPGARDPRRRHAIDAAPTVERGGLVLVVGAPQTFLR